MFKVIISNNKDKWKEENSLLSDFKGGSFDITINSKKTYQTLQGFGGAFTDATVENFLLLNKEEQDNFINLYFSKDGLGYNLGRYPIHSTDFSSYSYDYLKDNSTDINNIDITKDKDKIELVKRCQIASGGLEIMMSVWSPFAWMKDNNSLYHGGHLKLEYFDTWSSYLARVVKILKDNEINITMITSQNEPQAVQTWESCIYSAEDEGVFVNKLSNYLKDNGVGNTKIYLVDHNRDLLSDRVVEIMKYCTVPVCGVAYHWYDHSYFENLTKMHDVYPNLHLLMSECCVELLVDKDPIGSLKHAEQYAYEMINDLNNYSEGYIDWNLLLNEQGGPNHVGNFCESPIMFNRKTKELLVLPTYYYIGHFSKYVHKGAHRLETTNNSELFVASFMNEDDSIICVVLNKSDEQKTINLRIDDVCKTLMVPSHSIITIIHNN